MRHLFLLALVAACYVGGAPRTLVEWTFDKPTDAASWEKVNHLTEVRAENGSLKGRIMDWDPWVTSPQFEIEATPWQRIEFRLKTDLGGSGGVYFSNTTETQYGGFTPGKNVSWQVNGDGKWHTYSVYPFWGAEKKIIMIRLDFARADGAKKGETSFELDWLRIVGVDQPPRLAKPPVWTFPGDDGLKPTSGMTMRKTRNGLELSAPMGDAWLESAFMSFPAEEAFWAVVRMATENEGTAAVSWISSKASSRKEITFEVIPDGKMRTYNMDLSGRKTWAEDIYFVGFRPPMGKGKTTLAEIAIQDEAGGPAMPVIRYAGLQNAINRAGRPAAFMMTVENRGGDSFAGGRIAKLSLPRGVRVVGPENWQAVPELDSFDRREHQLQVTAGRPVKGPFTLTIAGAGETVEYKGEVEFLPALDLPKANYVPEPQPVESDYEIGALYFPRWYRMDEWAKIRATDPQRKPVLGWYDERNPEVVDWQIKWAVENGIQFFMVDWYWSKGSINLEHWIQAYQKARYRKYLKWCMMYANHNAKGSHSEEDQRAATKYWIDNYFNMPEYYRIDDKPVVMYWSPAGLKRDMGGEPGGAKKLLEISRQMAREAGYKGIHFISMKWPEASTNPKDIEWLKDEGFDMTSLYHFMHHGGKAENPRRFPFKLVADCSYDWWKARQKAGVLPFLPNLSTGWHSRPWHGDRGTWIIDKNVPDFRRICEDAKRFADETGVKRMVMAPLNEWGEGSYAEPNKEFGFGMYESVRNTFCKKPATGWPRNLAPGDVGLGPYDLPDVAKRSDLTAWDFNDGQQGWGKMMGIGEFEAKDGKLRIVTSSTDPALSTPLGKVRARNYREVAIRIRITPPPPAGGTDTVQLFWQTTTNQISEATAARVELKSDGQFHDYVIKVGENRRWRGRLAAFRLDPCSRSGATVEIDSIKLVK